MGGWGGREGVNERRKEREMGGGVDGSKEEGGRRRERSY